MKVLHAVLVLCGLGLGFVLAEVSPAGAQPKPAPPAQRYQISAFAVQAPNGDTFHGCYTVDTATGELWLSVPGGTPDQKLSEARVK